MIRHPSDIGYLFSMGATIFVAASLTHYMGFDQRGWVVLTSFLCSQTTRGTPLRQGIIFFMVMMLATIAAVSIMFIQWTLLTYLLVGSLFVLSGSLLFIYQPLTKKATIQVLLFVSIMMIAIFSPITNQVDLSHYLLSIVIGAGVGILINQCYMTFHLNKAFLGGVTPLLKSLKPYSATLTAMLTKEVDKKRLAVQKREVEKSMLSRYPSWVYETGFNRELRAGWRYFLLHLERVVELYFSIEFIAYRHANLSLLADYIAPVMQKNEELLDMLIHYTETRENKKSESDFTSDLSALEEALKRNIPNHIELIDIAPDYVTLTMLVKDLRDLRGLLLQLLMTLPA